MTQWQRQLPHEEIVSLYRSALVHNIPLDEVDQSLQKHAERLVVADRMDSSFEETQTVVLKQSVPAFVRLGAFILPVICIAFGLYLVGMAMVPIAGYYLKAMTGSDLDSALASPIPSEQVMDATPVVISKRLDEEGQAFIPQTPRVIDLELDYTNLVNWFDPATLSQLDFSQEEQGEIDEYVIEIPKLDIANAEVAVGGTDLNKSLIAYPGTALPGEHGAPVIFGHSVLRQFYNPSEKNPRRYNSIFSTIMTLKSGDEIFVYADGVKYTYIVQDKTEV
ncbi:MAG: sortase, partial [Patescibacteria group bacterium]